MSNKSAATAFRNDLILHMHAHGFDAAARPPEPKGLTATERAVHAHGDILGLPWTVGVRNSVSIALASAQDEVCREAKAEGKDFFASIQSRRGHGVEDSFVTMPLSVWLKVLQLLGSSTSRVTASAGPSQ